MPHRWYTVLWALLGPCPPVVAVLGERGRPAVYATLALSAALALGYAAVRLLPESRPWGGRPPLPAAFVVGLVPVLGSMAALPGGGAALYLVSFPLFWIHSSGPRRAVALSGAAAVATVCGGVLGQDWNPDLTSGNVIAVVVGYPVGTLLGLWLHQMVRQSDQRAARLSGELELTRHQLAESHRREGAAEERERIARDIHDTLAQGFASIVVLAEVARAGLPAGLDEPSARLRSIEQTARENLAEARALVGAGQPDSGAPGPVADVLRRILERFAEDTGIAVSAELPDLVCDQPTRIALLRCTQESLANVRKHAGASAVGVVLAEGRGSVELEITDDGRGFVVGESPGFGLEGMRRRLAEFGGELTVTSSPGDGTRVLATLATRPELPYISEVSDGSEVTDGSEVSEGTGVSATSDQMSPANGQV